MPCHAADATSPREVRDNFQGVLSHTVLVASIEAHLRDLLESTPAAPFVGSDNGKFLDSVRAITMQHLAVLEHLQR